jgi:hypothetical protein
MNWPSRAASGLGKPGEGIQCPMLAIWLEVLLKFHATSVPFCDYFAPGDRKIQASINLRLEMPLYEKGTNKDCLPLADQ